MEVVGLVAGIVSLILGIYAIWLSVVFYKMSNDASEKIAAASNEISSNVKRLDSLFDRMYTDTFSLVRDSYSDMRQQMWARPVGGNFVDGDVPSGDRIASDDKDARRGGVSTSSVPIQVGDVNQIEHRDVAPNHRDPIEQKAMDAMRLALKNAWARRQPVKASDLAVVAQTAGVKSAKAIDLLFQLGEQREFFVAGEGLSPSSRLLPTKEMADAVYKEGLLETVQSALGLSAKSAGSVPGPSAKSVEGGA